MDNNLNEMLEKMKEYRSTSPEFSDAIKVLGTDTPNHAEAVNAATRQLLDNTVELKNEMVCNLLYLPDAANENSAGGVIWRGGRFICNIPSADMEVWSGKIALPEGGYAFPASSDSADVIVVYTLDGKENRVEISAGAVLPEGAVVTEYCLERKDGESRIVADVWPMISPGQRPVTEFVPYTGDGRRMNRCVALVLKAVEKLHKFCLEKFLTKEDIANNLVTTNAGWALDARQGKVLKDEIDGINADLSRKLTLVASDGIQGGKASVSFDADIARMYFVTFKSTGLYDTHRILYAGIVSIVGVSTRKLHVNNIVNDCSSFNVSITNDGMTIKIYSNSHDSGYERIFVWAI